MYGGCQTDETVHGLDCGFLEVACVFDGGSQQGSGLFACIWWEGSRTVKKWGARGDSAGGGSERMNGSWSECRGGITGYRSMGWSLFLID